MNNYLNVLMPLIMLLFLGSILGGVILGGLALARIKALARRVRALEGEAGVEGAPAPPAARAASAVAADDTAADRAAWPPRAASVETEAEAEADQPASITAEASAPQSAGARRAAERSSPAPTPTPARRRSIEWERLLGVRGAAILGGVALVIAALFFFQYAIQEGWFDERARVWTGAAVGTLCLLIQGGLRAKGYRIVADVLAGSGAVVHYSAAWAGFRLYELFPPAVGFAWMALTTIVCCVLALRASSQLIAVFGLVGGFATPLLLSTAPAGAASLFGYILLLDLALLGIGRRRDWAWLGLLGLLGTTGIQFLWLLEGHTADAALGLAACGVFGLLFAGFGGDDGSPFRLRWRVARIGGVLLPFGLALHYATLVELGDDYWLIAAVAALLAGTATFLGRRMELPGLPTAAAAGAAALSATWLFGAQAGESSLIEFALGTGATALVLAALGVWPRREQADDVQPATTYSLLILFAVAWTVVGFVDSAAEFWPICLVVWIHLAVTVRARAALPALPVLAALAAGLALASLSDGLSAASLAPSAAGGPPLAAHLSPLVAALTATVLLLLAIFWRKHPAPRALALAALCCVFWVLFLQGSPSQGASPAEHHAPIVFAVLVAACAAARCANAATVGAVVLLSSWALFQRLSGWRVEELGWSVSEVLPWLLAGIGATTLAPVFFQKHLAGTRAVGLIAAASALIGLDHIPLERWIELWKQAFADHWIGCVPLILAAPPALAALFLRGEGGPADAPDGVRSARTAYAMVACLLCALALPLQLDTHQPRGIAQMWGWIGCAPAAVVWAWLASRRSSRLWSLTALAAAICAGLPWCVLALTPGEFDRQEALLVNGFSYSYGITFVALLLVLRFTATPIMDGRAGAGQAPATPGSVLGRAIASLHAGLVYEQGHWCPRFLLRSAVGALACLIPFAWVSLLVINGHGESVHLRPASIDLNGNLMLSLAWALYSLTLLALGTGRGVVALRWASLLFLLATIAKVFLFDLANLAGLQRVGSFLGLAVCLILVSLFYQRFVFGRDARN